MASIQVRYLVSRPGVGGLPRWFWQPHGRLRVEGFRTQRVPADWARYADATALEAAAIAAAQALNSAMDAARAGRLEAAVQPPAPAVRTVSALIAEYTASNEFKSRAKATQRGYRQCLAKLEGLIGDAPVAAIDEVRVQKLRAKLSATPAYANACIRVLRLLFEHGRRTGWRPWLPVNPAERPNLQGSDPSGIIWPPAAVAAFVAAADAHGRHSLGTAVMLNEWLGQREGDVLRFARNALRGNRLLVRQGKTGAGVPLPLGRIAPLVARVEAELLRSAGYDPLPSTILVCETTRLPWQPDFFRHEFARIRAIAAKAHPSFEIDYLLPGRDPSDPAAFTVRMQDLTFMHLRHTAVTRLAEAGSDLAEICSISGHSMVTAQTILKRYMVRTSALAERAIQRRLDAEAATVKGASNAG